MPHQTHPNEDSLRDEVIFLHALWHQGPPNPNPNPNPQPLSNFHRHLKPTHSTPFKKKSKTPLPPISDNPWPVPPDPPTPPLSNSGWPEFPPISSSPPPIQAAPNGYMARDSAVRLQQRGFDSFRSLFAGSESESDSDDDDHDQDRVFNDGFLEVFDGNEELKGYYQNNWGNGEFMCLVCGGSGQKVGRKYKDCVALIQHTVTISNTKKRAAHRAYGLVVCKVLGWDIHQLPLVSRNLSLQQGKHMSSAEACKDDPVGVETHIASFLNEDVQSDPSATTSDVGNDNAAEEKKTDGLPSVLDNPGEIDETINVGTSTNTNHSDAVAVPNEHGLLDPTNSTTTLNSVGEPNGNLHLKPYPSTTFKRKGEKKKGKNPHPRSVSVNPWPASPDVPDPPAPSESVWPEFGQCQLASAPVASEEERARVSSLRAQQKGLDSFRSFFTGIHGSESERESDDDQDQDCSSNDECRFSKFFEVFEGNEELKGYYQKNWGNGDFMCLVCGGSGQKVGRKYKTCVALIQHTRMISKTKKKAAHRVYGLVVCKVLGWDIHQLPLVSRNLSLQQGNDVGSAEACKYDSVGVGANSVSLVDETEHSDPSKVTSDTGKDNSAEKKETSDLPLVLNTPDVLQINDTSNAGTSTNHSDTVAVLNEHELLGSPKAAADEAAEKKETSGVPCS